MLLVTFSVLLLAPAVTPNPGDYNFEILIVWKIEQKKKKNLKQINFGMNKGKVGAGKLISEVVGKSRRD